MSEESTKFCTYCGTRLPGEANFCFNCGKSCNGVEQQQVEENVDIDVKLSQIYSSTSDSRVQDNIKVILSSQGYSTGVKKIRAQELFENGLLSQLELNTLILQLDLDFDNVSPVGSSTVNNNGKSDKKKVPLTKKGKIKQLKKEAAESGLACCPKCGSTSLSGNKKGFGIGKAVVGAAITGGIGLIAGNKGAKKVRITCLNCGHQWWAGK